MWMTLRKTDGILLLLALKQMSLGIGYILFSANVATVTANKLPSDFYAFAGVPFWLVGLGFIALSISVIFVERRAWLKLTPRWIILSGVLLFLQFLSLIFSATGGIVATFNGAYLDGTVIPRWHIWEDQSVYVFLVVVQAFVGVRCFSNKLQAVK